MSDKDDLDELRASLAGNAKMSNLLKNARFRAQPLKHTGYVFPAATLDPGQEQTVEAKTNGDFRGSRLVFLGEMDEIRGRFKIKYSRLPLLNREHVIAYSNVTRIKAKRRTTIEYREEAEKCFVRSYLPSSVEYVPTDPLEYVLLTQLKCDEERAMPSSGGGVSTAILQSARFGTGVPLPTTRKVISLLLKNSGDIQVRVHATIFGVERG